MNDAPLHSQHSRSSAFTIVELLIVVVVIAILAAIALISYNGITSQAEESALKSDLRNTSTKIALHKASTDDYPDALEDIDSINSSSDLQYTKISGNTFCLSAASPKNETSFHITESGSVQEGSCPATPAACFAFNPGSNAITNYYNNEGNNPDNPACPRGVVIPSQIGGVDVTRIGYPAFNNKQLVSVVLPKTITRIDSRAFDQNNLKSISLHEGIVELGDYAFANNQISQVKIPNSVKGGGFNNIVNPFSSNPVQSYTIGTADYDGPAHTVIHSMSCDSNCEHLTSVTINGSVKEIINSGFSGYPNLSSITIHPNVELIAGGSFMNLPSLKHIALSTHTIRQSAFINTGLTSVTFTTGVQRIIEGAFQNNPGLTSVSIPAATEVAPSAFSSGVVITRY